MVGGVSAVARGRVREQDSDVGLHAWLETDPRRRNSLAFAPYAIGGDPALPPVVSRLDAAEIGARIASWRAASAPLDALFLQGVPPAAALRRFGLTHWSMNNVRAASAILAVAAALAPNDAALWLDLGSTLHACGEAAEARPAFERALALDAGLARAWLGLALVANALTDPEAAERAFAAALQRDPQLSEAAFGLGLLCFEQRRYAEAVAHWRRAIGAGSRHGLVHAGLGQALFFTGDFSGAAREMATQIAGGVGVDQKLTRRYALARFLEAAIVADDVAAFSAYREAARADAEDEATVARTAFSLLSAYGHRDAAIRLGRARLPHGDDDPIQRYLFDAVVGEKLDRAPRDYLIAYFDRFAETFDKQLVDVLGYDVPEKLARLVAAHGSELPRAVDLGCGTGLAAQHLRPGRSRLVGVDLSPRMLAKSAKRRAYDELVEADMIAFLEQTGENFDLVFAADALIYLGALDAFLSAAARVMPPGALLAFNVETTDAAPYALLPSGRFAHELSALRDAAAAWFAPSAEQATVLRTEACTPVEGALVLFERRAA
jgi:predicted TPR repeat methyltransferase